MLSVDWDSSIITKIKDEADLYVFQLIIAKCRHVAMHSLESLSTTPDAQPVMKHIYALLTMCPS